MMSPTGNQKKRKTVVDAAGTKHVVTEAELVKQSLQ